MKENLIQTGKSKHTYYTFGKGAEPLLAFHGFGQSGKEFLVFEKYIGDKFTIYAFDVLHHGNSEHDGEPVTENDLKELVKVFTKQHSITKFSLLGFSLGGKIVLKLIELFHERLNNVILLSPDGLKINPLYRFSTVTSPGRFLFRGFIKNPAPVSKTALLLKNMKILDPKIYNFMYSQIRTKELREKIYKVWITYQNINPDLDKIAALVNKNTFRFMLVFGKHDRVIHPKYGERFVEKLKDKNSFVLLNTGHQLISEKVGEYLKKELVF
ncbi:MAG: 2-succinyl-6-hydroxy-2,4-cyclohexadiene-1-carboxylate synthase [Bacteroidia bacterium]|nr:2-succinyl-6-hydroxy-2,4-cyclohexadiene-1-carboxylate synthase [Bacteroidia bacterium]